MTNNTFNQVDANQFASFIKNTKCSETIVYDRSVHTKKNKSDIVTRQPEAHYLEVGTRRLIAYATQAGEFFTVPRGRNLKAVK